ncbi:O-antigen polymerase [Pseudidiomarina insulisalsae]|uniref:Oligosaccharide repeat unit polymerase n=1 Tax=Pseudidiomarina insulisalsae TaxID=575789 RepID=A0A432YNW3_9GAMM|nr:O-antigen polymerase [Pseudidiomarina insulisalsae]RUO62640.1 hypothetical protein CWI71_04200 [Pseudidiomarina insulisalsae]
MIWILCISYFLFTVIIAVLCLLLLRNKLPISRIIALSIALGLATFWLVHIFIPSIQLFFSSLNRIEYGYSVGVYVTSLVSSLSFILTAIITFTVLVVFNYQGRGREKLATNLRGFQIDYVASFLIIGACVPIVFFVFIEILKVGLPLFLINRISILKDFSAFTVVLNMLIFLGASLFFRYLQMRNLKSMIFFVLFSLSLFILFSLIGSRNSIFIYIGVLLFAYLVCFRKISIFKFSAVGAFSFLSLAVVGSIRTRLEDLNTGMLKESIHKSFESTISVFGNDEILRFLITRRDDFSLQMGDTFMSGFLSIVPRFFWEGKPLGAGPLVTNLINPNSYIYGSEGISSYTTGIVAESYLNFGIFGGILCGFVWAVLMYLVGKYKTKSSLTFYLQVFVMFMLSASIFYSEFLGFAIRIYIISIFTWSVLFVSKAVRRLSVSL